MLLETDSLAATLSKLVAIDSVNPAYGGPEGGEQRAIDWIADFLQSKGIETETWPVFPGRMNLHARLKGRDPNRTLLFESHIDTVSTQGMTIAPHGGEVRDGRLWGRGATDAKGQVVSMLHAFAAVAESGEAPPMSLELVIAVDEESGFGGVRALVERYQKEGNPPVAAVVGEPTELDVVVAHKGTLRFWIEVEGRAAHTSIAHEGINAIEHAAALILKIQRDYSRELTTRSHPLLGSPTVVVSKVEGGVQVNLVPPKARLLIDRRTIPGETHASVFAEFDRLIEKVKAKIPNLKAQCIQPLMVDPSLETAPDSPIVAAACRISRAMGRGGKPLGVPYGTDASKLSDIGIPTIVAGPGSIAQAHIADEFIDLDALTAGAQFMVRMMQTDLPA